MVFFHQVHPILSLQTSYLIFTPQSTTMRFALHCLLFLLLSCSIQDETAIDIGKKYTVQSGRHDFLPSPIPFPQSAKSISGSAVLHSSCWYDNLGVDNADWNKLCGFYRYADLIKNKNAVIISWRPDQKIRDLFELILYENIDGRNVPHESAIYKVKAGEQFYFDFVLNDGKYTLLINGNTIGTQANDRKYRTVGKISAWFGGNRTAPHTMWLWLNF